MKKKTRSDGRKVTVRFAGQAANFYDVGYLMADIYQVIVFSSLVAEGRKAEATRWFVERKYPISRWSPVLQYHQDEAVITDVRRGSIELGLEHLPDLTVIVLGLLSYKANLRQLRYAEIAAEKSVQFEISVDDPKIKRLLDAYEAGTFGDGAEALNFVFNYLSQRGYDVHVKGPDAYSVERVLDKYSRRIVRTLRRR